MNNTIESMKKLNEPCKDECAEEEKDEEDAKDADDEKEENDNTMEECDSVTFNVLTVTIIL